MISVDPQKLTPTADLSDADLSRMVMLMREPALILGWCDDGADGCQVRHANHQATRALRVDPIDIIPGRLARLMPTDTARQLCRLCLEAMWSNESQGYVALAPDPMTDLTGTSSVSVRVTPLADVLLCTWTAGRHPVGDEAARLRATAAGNSVADRLELADTTNAITTRGLAVFSLDLRTGRFVCSAGVRRLFDIRPDTEPIYPNGLLSVIESDSATQRAWRALVVRAEPMDMEVRLRRRPDGLRLRLVARARLAPDGYPAAIRGQCMVVPI